MTFIQYTVQVSASQSEVEIPGAPVSSVVDARSSKPDRTVHAPIRPLHIVLQGLQEETGMGERRVDHLPDERPEPGIAHGKGSKI